MARGSEHMPDSELEQLIAGLRAAPLDFTAPVAEPRAQFEALLATIPVSDDISFGADDLGGVPAITASTPGARSDAALLYLHGGAYVAGSAQGYRGLAAELGRAAGVQVFSIDYRLAPEHPFPAAIDDAVTAWRALLDRGFDPTRVVVAGDSAGGGLTLAMLIALRDAGVRLPAAALLISPWADVACTGESIRSKAAEDPALTAESLLASAAHYLAGGDPRHPLASPCLGDLRDLPPLLIQVGSAEILLDDSIRVARAAGAAGVDVRLEIWPQMVHVWHAFAFMLSAGRRAIGDAGTFLSSRIEDAR